MGAKDSVCRFNVKCGFPDGVDGTQVSGCDVGRAPYVTPEKWGIVGRSKNNKIRRTPADPHQRNPAA